MKESTWRSLSEVLKISRRVGYVFAQDDSLAGIDLDWKVSGSPSPLQQNILSQFPDCYIESSPSGKGVHIIFSVDKSRLPQRHGRFEAIKKNDLGVEFYAAARYFTVTGQCQSATNDTPDATDRVLALFAELKPIVVKPLRSVDEEKPPRSQLERALSFLDPDCSYEQWVNIGMALHDWNEREGLELWEAWSSNAVVKWSPGACHDKWASFQAGNGITVGTLFNYAAGHGFQFKLEAAEEFASAPEPELLALPVGKEVKQYVHHDAHELLERTPNKVSWWLEDLLPMVGVVLIGARPKAGKSMMVLSLLVHSYLAGGEFLGAKITKPRKFLYLDLESSRDRATRRLHQARAWLPQTNGGSLNGTFVFESEQGKNGFDSLNAALDQDPQVQVVVIDTLQAFRGLSGKGNAYEEDYLFVKKLVDIARERNLLLIVVHHTKKGSAVIENGIDSMSGTFGLTGAADAVWLLERLKGQGKGQFLLDAHGRDVEQRYLQVACDWELFGWQLVKEVDEPWELLAKKFLPDAMLDAVDDREDRVLAALKEALKKPGEAGSGAHAPTGCMSYRGLNKALNLAATSPRLNPIMDKLVDEGKVRLVGKYFQLVDPDFEAFL